MAGEWIKVNSNLHTKPEVFKMARLLAENVDTTVGLLLRFWVWADGVTVDGLVDAVESQDVDAVVKRVGFFDALLAVGWVKPQANGAGIELVNFTRHNGESTKKRALKSERQARWRAGKVDAPSSTQASTREEKRREDKRPIGVEVPEWMPKPNWDSFVEMRKKGKSPFTDQAQRLAISALSKLRDEGHPPAALIDAAVLNGWKSFYPPKGGTPSADPPWKGAK